MDPNQYPPTPPDVTVIIVAITITFLILSIVVGWCEVGRWSATDPNIFNISVNSSDTLDDNTFAKKSPTHKQPEKDEDEFEIQGKLAVDLGVSEDGKVAMDTEDREPVREGGDGLAAISIWMEGVTPAQHAPASTEDHVAINPPTMTHLPTPVVVLYTRSPPVGDSPDGGQDAQGMVEEWVPKPFDPRLFEHVHAPSCVVQAAKIFTQPQTFLHEPSAPALPSPPPSPSSQDTDTQQLAADS
ncbi:hypothetical protein BGW42_002858 [Actinomortierella wolfii]|nr:hypothetical protein BGW42_002858 [Actinomortierella wolfii]